WSTCTPASSSNSPAPNAATTARYCRAATGVRRWSGYFRPATRSTVKSPTSSSPPTDATPVRSRAKSKSASTARRPRPEAAARKVRVELGERGYDIRIGPRLLADPASYAPLRSRVVRLVTDANVAGLYLDSVLEALGLSRAEALVLPAGEKQKS